MSRLSRRTFLRGTVGGVATALALPVLDAMLDPNGALADGDAGPIFGVFFWANGLPWHAAHGAEQAGHADLWTPSTQGPGFAPTELLMELARHRVSVVTGLEPHTAIPASPPGQGDGHMRGFMVALTGDRIRPEGFDHPSHTLTALRPSIDQVVADHPQFHRGGLPPYRTLHLGVSRARFHDYGHWNAISYNGPDSLNLPTMNPGALWDQLFGGSGDYDEQTRRSEVLDSVLDEARALQSRLGAHDRARVEQHLEHLFEVQRRMSSTSGACGEGARPSGSSDLLLQNDQMAELLAIALQCGLTRVFTYMLTSPATTHVFPGVPDGMHKTCHDGHWVRVRSITAYQMEAFGRFLDAMEASVDPLGQSLMDRLCIFGTSEYGEGWKHDNHEHPVVFAGGACGALNRGVHTRIAGGNLSRAHLTAFRALGLDVPTFGFNGGETRDHIPGLI